MNKNKFNNNTPNVRDLNVNFYISRKKNDNYETMATAI